MMSHGVDAQTTRLSSFTRAPGGSVMTCKTALGTGGASTLGEGVGVGSVDVAGGGVGDAAIGASGGRRKNHVAAAVAPSKRTMPTTFGVLLGGGGSSIGIS